MHDLHSCNTEAICDVRVARAVVYSQLSKFVLTYFSNVSWPRKFFFFLFWVGGSGGRIPCLDFVQTTPIGGPNHLLCWISNDGRLRRSHNPEGHAEQTFDFAHVLVQRFFYMRQIVQFTPLKSCVDCVDACAGMITQRTFTAALQALDVGFSEPEVIGMLHWADPQGDQRIGLRQFVRMFADVQGISLPPTDQQSTHKLRKAS